MHVQVCLSVCVCVCVCVFVGGWCVFVFVSGCGWVGGCG
jgi:hypothetical protein